MTRDHRHWPAEIKHPTRRRVAQPPQVGTTPEWTHPAQRPRLVQIRDNLRDRITEAQQKNWLGEVEGLHVSLAAATSKLAQLDELATRRNAVHLGMPTFTESAGRTITIPCSF